MEKNIAIVTFHDDNCNAYAMLSDKSKQFYCDKFGYKYFVHSVREFEERHCVWEKPNAMLKHFNKFDYIVWTDADACISNMNFDIANIFSDDSKTIYISIDCYGYNAGVFAVKTNDTGKMFLNDVNLGYDEFKNASFREQSCISFLLKNKYSNDVLDVPIKKWNCYDNVYRHRINNIFEDGDFILHLPAEDQLPKTNPPYRVKRFTEINRKNGI